MKRVLFVLMLVILTLPVFAQNEDKETKLRPSQYMDHDAFETTPDAYRTTFVPGYSTTTATIDTNTSVSDSLDLGDSRIIGFMFPSAWTAASVTFLTWNPVLSGWGTIEENDGNELTYVVTDSVYVIADPTHFAGVRYLKIRSGTSTAPVNQGDDRSIAAVLRRY